MNDSYKNSQEYKRTLVRTYIFSNFLNSLSLLDRIEYDLGWTHYDICPYNKEFEALPIEKLEEMCNNLKKPWWYDMYKDRYMEIDIHKGIKKDRPEIQELYNKLKDIYTPSFETFTEENLKLLKEFIGIKD